MRNIWLILKREYVEATRKKSFWIGTFLVPLLIVAIMGFSIWSGVSMAERDNEKDAQKVSPYSSQIHTLREKLDDLETKQDAWFKAHGEDEDAQDMTEIIGMVVAILVLTMSMMYGGMMQTSVLEEKQSRLAEIMITSVKPFDMLMGKLLGVTCIALTQIAIWFLLTTAATGVVASFLPEMMGTVTTELVSQTDLPTSAGALIDTAQSTTDSGNVQMLIDTLGLQEVHFGELIIVSILCLLLGFLMVSGLCAMVASAVDNMQEAQQMQSVLVIICMLPMYVLVWIVDEPNGALATALSIFPLTAPVVMPIRAAIGMPVWQVVISLLIMLLTVVGIIWATAKVYRIGMLRYGKKGNWKEIIQWIINK